MKTATIFLNLKSLIKHRFYSYFRNCLKIVFVLNIKKKHLKAVLLLQNKKKKKIHLPFAENIV